MEHWKYWTFPVGLVVSDYSTAVEPMGYTHLKDSIPLRERPRWMEARGKDFVGADIVYGGPCVAEGERVNEYDAGRFTTDVEFIVDDGASISKDGFLILACTFNGTDYSAIVATGALSGNGTTNAPMSWANLERDFWTWDRFMREGNVNGQDVVFDGFIPNIEQKGVVVKSCCDVLDFEASDRVTTSLGKRLGTVGNPNNAFIQREEVLELDGTARYTLRYAY